MTRVAILDWPGRLYNGEVTRFIHALLAGSLGLSLGCLGEDEPSPPAEGMEAKPPPPRILGPLLVTVGAADRADIEIDAADLQPNTRAELDGRSWSLRERGPVSRARRTVVVSLAGALVVGVHELVLVHELGGEELRSEPLVIGVEAASLGPLAVTLDSPLVGAGDRLVHAGPNQTLLALVDEAGQTIELRRDGWATAGSVQGLPGLVSPASPSAAVVDVTLAQLDALGRERWVITTWLAEGGARVRARITPLEPSDQAGGGEQLGEPGEVIELWNLADPEHRAALGPHQLAFNHGVALLGRRVVIAVEARRDADQPSLGDHLLVTRWLAADGTPAAPALVRGPNSRDLDHPYRARRWLGYWPTKPALSVRVGLGFAWLLELAGNGLPMLTGDPGDPGDPVSVAGELVWMASADGALGSRHVFMLEQTTDRAWIHALRIDRWGAAEPGETAALLELPGLPSGAPSLSSVAGSPTLLIPMGGDQPTLVLRSTGAAVVLDSLALLHCDALALAEPPADAEGDSRALACLATGGLRVGALGGP